MWTGVVGICSDCAWPGQVVLRFIYIYIFPPKRMKVSVCVCVRVCKNLRCDISTEEKTNVP